MADSVEEVAMVKDQGRGNTCESTYVIAALKTNEHHPRIMEGRVAEH